MYNYIYTLKFGFKMRNIYLLLIFQILYFINILSAQSRVEISFVDNADIPISYVTIHNSVKKIYAMSDFDGKWDLQVKKGDSFMLHTEIIGFKNTSIPIFGINDDTSIVIKLSEDIDSLKDVTVYAEKPNTRGMKIKEAGFYKGKEAGAFGFRAKTKVGVLMKIPPSSS